jgi:hypothetical protein
MARLKTRLREHPVSRKVLSVAGRHKLPAALVLAISAALLLTVVSVGMYYAAGFYRYDLSRPGYEKERTEIAKPTPQKEYDTTSPVTKGTIDGFLEEFDARQKDLKAYGDYRDPSLTDEDLLLTNITVQQ